MFNSESLDAATLPASKNTKVTAQQLAFSANRLADFVAQKEEARIEAETKAHDAITAALVTTSGQVYIVNKG